MKKLIYLLIIIFAFSCSSDDNSQYNSFADELENSVYIEKGTHIINGVTEKWENHHTFKFSNYGFKQNGFTVDGDFRATCYSTYIFFENGQIISEYENSLTYVQGGNTFTITKIDNETIKFQNQSASGGGWNYSLLKSDFETLETLKVGKRSSNGCN